MPLKSMLKYRTGWLGAAMICIAFFHSEISVAQPLLYWLKTLGYGGVDICLFASGAGCYYSLTKDPDVGSFIKKRLRRLLPTYLCFIAAWLVYKYIDSGITFQMALGNIFAVQSFTGLGQEFNWYISAILLFYFLAPYLKRMADGLRGWRQAAFLCFLVALSFPFWTVTIYLMIITRLPIFYIGMLFGKKCMEGARLDLKYAVITGAAFAVGVLMLVLSYSRFPFWQYGLPWYPFILLTPGLCIILTGIMMLLEKVKALDIVRRGLELIGDYSFEVYLVHLPLIAIISSFMNRFALWQFSGFVWAGGVAVLALLCFLLRKAAGLSMKLFTKLP